MSVTYPLSSDLPSPLVFIKIPSTVKASIETRFDDADRALEYIKKSIEKHLALGVYYVIIDENDEPWDKPFPSTSPKGFTLVNPDS